MKWVRDGEGRSGIGRIVLITNLRRWFRETGISRAESEEGGTEQYNAGMIFHSVSPISIHSKIGPKFGGIFISHVICG
jgi:hypothetical protein